MEVNLLLTLLLFLLVKLSSLFTDMDFEKINYDYSMKNIPIPTNEEHQIELIHSVEKVIGNLRKHGENSLRPKKQSKQKETYEFKSTRKPPNVPELKQLEEKLYNLVKNVKYNNNTNEFQKTLKKDKWKIKNEKKILLKGDKSSNYYRISPEDHEKFIFRNISKDSKNQIQVHLRQT